MVLYWCSCWYTFGVPPIVLASSFGTGRCYVGDSSINAFPGMLRGNHIWSSLQLFGSQGVSGCLQGIISVALIIRSISRLHILPFGVFGGLLALVIELKIIQLLSPRISLVWYRLVYSCSFLYYMHVIMTKALEVVEYPVELRWALYVVGGLVGFIAVSITHGLLVGGLGGMFGTVIGSFTGLVVIAIMKGHYALVYSVGSVFLSSVLFGTVGWYHHGFVIGLSLFALLGARTEYNVFQEDDLEGTGSKVLYFTCRMLGVGIAGFSLPLCTKLVDLMLRWLAGKHVVVLPLHFIQRMCWYASGIVRRIIPVGLISSACSKLMWMWALLAWIAIGSALGGLCGQAVLMLAGQSNSERVAGGSLIVSGGVIGALAGYSILGLGGGVPVGVGALVGVLVGAVVPSIILLQRGGFNFKSYFLKTNFLLMGSLQKLFARFGL